ncbi:MULTISPECIES: hypothetical protein [Acidithiobacillus]|uniref:Uncharacterized protein n=1 Tax=Acidithiobacillus ferriphilus TaxID=1689834 RepID=A0ABU6FKN3_9PROT|nr:MULTISPECIES: hypothetical protein [Acidithiobacillus]MBU2854707.1 hypothetical protein [Acidithiobacillus ferriphilus]MEB8487456.1 hypothetical protein [Acidithiobacillus ferriphilus]MEB8489200.1 hypothetical protein [Acidithiobacillus ferriphilus]MEB8494179.1 hypothetical protein [Acidithiobacillus ferriphilus]MEB8512609.1 hypothetical protein [Acidithiobacillus ferriphilus]
MKKAIIISIIMLSILIAEAPMAFAIDFFSTRLAAHNHCPHDTVVWLNTATGIWHYKGERWYGNTRQGAYVCEREAARAGDRGTENGQ